MSNEIVSRLIQEKNVLDRSVLLDAAVEITALQTEVMYLRSMTLKLQAQLDRKSFFINKIGEQNAAG